MKLNKTLTISALALCGLSVGLAISSPADRTITRPTIQADGGMPNPPIKKPGSRLATSPSSTGQLVADGGMPNPPIKKPSGRVSA